MGKAEEIYKQQSKEKLKYIAKKRIDTTMIGSLASIEKHFGFLWGQDVPENQELTPEQQLMSDIFENLRSEILDKGNNQIRIFNNELENYEVSLLRYQMTLPVVR